MAKRDIVYQFKTALLLCILHVAGIDVFAQESNDSIIIAVEEYIPSVDFDSLAATVDSLGTDSVFISVADSLRQANDVNLGKIEKVENVADNSEITLLPADSVAITPEKKMWLPDPNHATWLAIVFPGGGQIYNRKYWKLPIIYGGFAGCAYALSWNNSTYKDYSQAYLDIMDKDPNTNSYYDLLPPGEVVNENTDTKWGPLLKKRKDRFRRYRDLSIFAFIGVYLISVIDAYVDAELSNFDIGPDLSMRIEPTIISDKRVPGNSIGLQWSIRF